MLFFICIFATEDNTPMFNKKEDIEKMIEKKGFLPFFYNGIEGFSIEEHTPKELWFNDEKDGPWEWKGPLIIEGGFAYGKFFQNKAGFISMDWFPDFLNYRRSTHRLSYDEQIILNTLTENESLLSKELKKLCGYVAPKKKVERNPLLKAVEKQNNLPSTRPAERKREAFDTAITKLQMSCHIITADFEYNYDKEGKRYGWGVARYCTPEAFFGAENFEHANYSPEESRFKIFQHLAQLLPHATEEQLQKLIG